jgi:uncharacterized protein
MMAFMRPPALLDPNEPFQLHLFRARFPGGGAFEGCFGEGDLPRLASSGLHLDGAMHWSARFSDDTLVLSVSATVLAPCGRCLQPVRFALQADRRFLCFETSAQADEALDVEEDTLETLSSQDGASLVSLCEDEALLAVGETPLHPDCSMLPGAQDSGDGERLRPFAGLEKLLQKK